jgi:hypothetical protein
VNRSQLRSEHTERVDIRMLTTTAAIVIAVFDLLSARFSSADGVDRALRDRMQCTRLAADELASIDDTRRGCYMAACSNNSFD